MARQVDELTAAGCDRIIAEAGEAELEYSHALMRERVKDLERCVLNPAAQRGEIAGDIPDSVSRLFFTFVRDRALFGPSTSDDISSFVDEVIMPLLKAHARPTSTTETPY